MRIIRNAFDIPGTTPLATADIEIVRAVIRENAMVDLDVDSADQDEYEALLRRLVSLYVGRPVDEVDVPLTPEEFEADRQGAIQAEADRRGHEARGG